MPDDDYFNPHPGWARVEDAHTGGGVNLTFSGTYLQNVETEEFTLRFPSVEDLGTWLDGPVVRAVEKYKAKKANTSFKVIERALEGSYRDHATQAEMIVDDLREAGYLITPAEPTPEPRDFVWRHPGTGKEWALDQWDVQDGLGDTWSWTGELNSSPGSDVRWPVLNRKGGTTVRVRWDHVEANGPLVRRVKR